MTRHRLAASTAALALAAVASPLPACNPAAAAAPAPTDEVIPVRTVPVARGPVDRPVRAAGLVATKDQWSLAFKAGGVLAAVEVHEGQVVRKGQVLARLDATELGAGARQAREGLEKARRDAARVAALVAAESASRQAGDDARTALAVAEAALTAAEFNLHHAVIVAPGDGWVDRRLAEPGEVVAPGRPIVEVSGQGRGFVVRAALPDRDALGLVAGVPATVVLDARPGDPLPGRVAELSRSAGRGTGTYQVEISLDSIGAPLLSGLTAKVEIARRVQVAGAVPLAAVVDGDGEAGAVFAVEGGRARRVPVRIAFLQGDRAVLAGGLDGLDRVVADGAPRLADGRAVRVVE